MLTLLYLILPVLAIVPLSFSSSTFLVYPIPGLSLRWYQNLFASDEWRMAAKNSFIVAPSATVRRDGARHARGDRPDQGELPRQGRC